MLSLSMLGISAGAMHVRAQRKVHVLLNDNDNNKNNHNNSNDEDDDDNNSN